MPNMRPPGEPPPDTGGLHGEPPRQWTHRHPNAKDDLRARARELRSQGLTYDAIRAELGVSKSSVSLWVRDLPRPEPGAARERAGNAARQRWDRELRRRNIERRQTKLEAGAQVGGLSDREVLLVGTALYWAEGSKDKAYARRERVELINSDPGLIRLFLRWLELLGVPRERWRCRVSIHETADLDGAVRYWSEVSGVPREAFGKEVIKKHNPRTVRRNVGEEYRGCFAVRVLDSADLYRRIEGWWYGIVVGARPAVREIARLVRTTIRRGVIGNTGHFG